MNKDKEFHFYAYLTEDHHFCPTSTLLPSHFLPLMKQAIANKMTHAEAWGQKTKEAGSSKNRDLCPTGQKKTNCVTSHMNQQRSRTLPSWVSRWLQSWTGEIEQQVRHLPCRQLTLLHSLEPHTVLQTPFGVTLGHSRRLWELLGTDEGSPSLQKRRPTVRGS